MSDLTTNPDKRADWCAMQAQAIIEPFVDGFAWSDLFIALPIALELINEVDGLSDLDQRELLCDLADVIIDTTDGWGPDSVIDPVLKKAVRFCVLNLEWPSRTP